MKATLAMSGLSAVLWCVVDKLCGHTYPHEGFRVWNTFICLLAFAMIGLILNLLRGALRAEHRAQQQLRSALEDIKRSTGEVRNLQNQLQVVCAWTKRIQVDGNWMDLDKFLADKLHFSITHAVSPEALEKVKQDLEQDGEH
jgi:hypothetical protein